MDTQSNTSLSTQQLVLKDINNSPLVLQNKKDFYYKKGEDPLCSADTLRYFYFIMSGKVKIYQFSLETAKEQILYLFSRGDMFDVIALLDGKPTEYMSEVLEDTHIVRIPLENVKKMMEDDPVFRQFFYSYVAQKLRSIEELAVSLSFYDVYQRVVQLFTKFIQVKNGKTELKMIGNLKHEDIAAMVGSARKVVNRTLQQLKKDDIIEISRKKIEIKNFQKLLDKLTL